MKLLVEEPAASRLGLLKTDPSLGLLAPALGRAGGGVAVQAVANTRNGEPVTRPTALKIPQQVPLTQDGGAVWGIAVGCTGSSGSDRAPEGPSNRGRRDAWNPEGLAKRFGPDLLEALDDLG